MRLAKVVPTIVLLLTFQWGRSFDCDWTLWPTVLFQTPVVLSSPLPGWQNSYLTYVEQRLKGDFVVLFQAAQEIVEGSHLSRTADYKQVSRTANKIRKLASRIKWGLTLGNQPAPEKSFQEGGSGPVDFESLQGKVDELSRLVYKIHQSSAQRNKHVLDARLQQELYAEVDALEILAFQVKVSADELRLNNRP